MQKLLHGKGNHQQNKKTTSGMGENICKWQSANIKNIK